MIGIGLAAYCLLTSPLLIVALVLLAFTAKAAMKGGTDRTVLGERLARSPPWSPAAVAPPFPSAPH